MVEVNHVCAFQILVAQFFLFGDSLRLRPDLVDIHW